MKKARFTESPVMRVLKEVEGGRHVKDVYRTRGFRSQLLQLEIQIWRHGILRHQENERTGKKQTIKAEVRLFKSGS